MQPYPHVYRASATGASAGTVVVGSPSLPSITTASPPEFDGPGGVWSPETLLCAAVADCFILTFRSIARFEKLSWLELECRVDGTLERVERMPQFTRFSIAAKLAVRADADVAKARKLLERVEQTCLVSNSLRGTRTLEMEVTVAPAER